MRLEVRDARLAGSPRSSDGSSFCSSVHGAWSVQQVWTSAARSAVPERVLVALLAQRRLADVQRPVRALRARSAVRCRYIGRVSTYTGRPRAWAACSLGQRVGGARGGRCRSAPRRPRRSRSPAPPRPLGVRSAGPRRSSTRSPRPSATSRSVTWLTMHASSQCTSVSIPLSPATPQRLQEAARAGVEVGDAHEELEAGVAGGGELADLGLGLAATARAAPGAGRRRRCCRARRRPPSARPPSAGPRRAAGT